MTPEILSDWINLAEDDTNIKSPPRLKLIVLYLVSPIKLTMLKICSVK